MRYGPALVGVVLVLAGCGGTGTPAWDGGSSDTNSTTSLVPAGPDEGTPDPTTPTGAAEHTSLPEATPPAEPEPPVPSGSGVATGTPATTRVEASSSTTTPKTTTTTFPATDGVLIELVIVDGSVEGGVRREPVGIGETVTLRVSGNTSDQVHVHGYDLYIDLHEGRGRLTFEASIPGIFEVELEGSHTPVLQLEVS